MERLKILIADGSSVYKKMFTQAVLGVDSDAVVACASSGDEAIDKIIRRDYDVVVIDAEISGLGAIALLEKIMRETPNAMVLIAARPSPANDKLCAEALGKGAADCMVKPIYDSYGENFAAIQRKMADVFETMRMKCKNPCERPPESAKVKKAVGKGKSRFQPEIVLIAASTGGPMALESVLRGIREGFPVPILVVQHMPPSFIEALARHLNQESKLRVKVAEHGETIEAGTVYAAPGGLHMRLDAQSRIRLDNSLPLNGVRPAADALFESVAECFAGSKVLTIVLTGMGRDGEAGLIRLKEEKECYCVAQSESTCVVYGMPRAVVERGLADEVLDLNDVSRKIESFYFADAGLA